MEIIENPKNKFQAKVLNKGDHVEEQFNRIFGDIFKDKVIIHRSVCEKSGTLEHDFLIEYGNYILVA